MCRAQTLDARPGHAEGEGMCRPPGKPGTATTTLAAHRLAACEVTECKENANIKWPKERWGASRKGTSGFFAEHVFVEEDRIPLLRNNKPLSNETFTDPSTPDEIQTRFIATWRGTGMQLEEVAHDVDIRFHLVTDHEFTQEQWGQLFLSAEYNGLGAARSQSFGRFVTTKFRKVRH